MKSKSKLVTAEEGGVAGAGPPSWHHGCPSALGRPLSGVRHCVAGGATTQVAIGAVHGHAG